MQPNFKFPVKLSPIGKDRGGWLLLVCLVCVGCTDTKTPTPTPTRQAYPNVSLKIACSDTLVSTELARRLIPWQQKTGAKVAFQENTDANADCVIIPARELGSGIAKKDFVPVSDLLRGSENSYKWNGLLGLYADRLCDWDGQTVAVPLSGDGFVLAYRADRLADPALGQAFSQKFGRPLVPPTTWEDFTDIAEFFADRGSPSLPPLADADRLVHEWNMIAACYDRQGQTSSALAAQIQSNKEQNSPTIQMLSFHHNLETGEPRLTRASFVQATAVLKRLARCRMPKGGTVTEPAASLVNGTAVLGVFSLRELGRLPRSNGAAPQTISVAAPLGTKSWCDAKTGRMTFPTEVGRSVNYVPYLGDNALVGMVRANCPNPEAAFAALGELMSQERSTDLITEPQLGFGPLRLEQLDQSRDHLWQRYGFDAERNRQLAGAIRGYLTLSLANPTFVMRTSDQATLMQAVKKELEAGMSTTPEQAMANVQAEWQRLDTSRPAADRIRERRLSSGVGAGS